RCVKTWHYRPVAGNDAPHDVNWKAEIIWNADVRGVRQRIEDCALNTPIDAAQLDGVDGVTELDVALEGLRAQSVTVTRSSGSAALDRAAVACLRWQDTAEIEQVTTMIVMREPMHMVARVYWQSVLRRRKAPLP
ncbi:MAG TPA: hypothetical protein VMU01_02290, partial [Rhizomicrobium sp.]|nr:hypothetical protein [Rhizomicrobium sp.]